MCQNHFGWVGPIQQFGRRCIRRGPRDSNGPIVGQDPFWVGGPTQDSDWSNHVQLGGNYSTLGFADVAYTVGFIGAFANKAKILASATIY